MLAKASLINSPSVLLLYLTDILTLIEITLITLKNEKEKKVLTVSLPLLYDQVITQIYNLFIFILGL